MYSCESKVEGAIWKKSSKPIVKCSNVCPLFSPSPTGLSDSEWRTVRLNTMARSMLTVLLGALTWSSGRRRQAGQSLACMQPVLCHSHSQHHRAKMDPSMTCGVIERVSVDNHNSSGTSRQQEQKGHYFFILFTYFPSLHNLVPCRPVLQLANLTSIADVCWAFRHKMTAVLHPDEWCYILVIQVSYSSYI